MIFTVFIYSGVVFSNKKHTQRVFFFIMIKVLAVKLTILIWAPEGCIKDY